MEAQNFSSLLTITYHLTLFWDKWFTPALYLCVIIVPTPISSKRPLVVKFQTETVTLTEFILKSFIMQ